MIGLAPIFLVTGTPIGLPVTTQIERVAAMLSYVLTIGQCAFVGLYGSTMRKMLYDRSFELKAAYKRIEELAELDELTGASNRRCIMRMLEEEIARATRAGSPCSIALIDLDWFKRINDAYGHPTGERCSDVLDHHVRQHPRVDRFGRYGGEEFCWCCLTWTPAGVDAGPLRAIIADLDWTRSRPACSDVSVALRAESERDVGHFSRAPTRALRSWAQDATALPAPDPTYSVPGGKLPPAFAPGQSHDFESRNPLGLLPDLQTTLRRYRRAPGRDPAPGNGSLHQRRGGLFGERSGCSTSSSA
jgi:GGDEF domain-containing protein